MKCYFCEKEFNSSMLGVKATFMGKEVYICEHCERLYKQMEREKIANKDTLLYCSARLTDDTTNPEVLKAMDKYVAEAMKKNEEYFQDRIARGEVEKHELWKCCCGAYNLKEDEYCMVCFLRRSDWEEEWTSIYGNQKLSFYTSKTNPRLETQQAEELSNFSVNLVWLIPLFILCIFLTGKFLAFTIIIGFTVWGLSGQKSYAEYYTVGEDSRIRNDLRIHEVNARKRSEENREILKMVLKQREFMNKARLFRHMIVTGYREEMNRVDKQRYVNYEKYRKNSNLLEEEYRRVWCKLNDYLREESKIIAVKYPFDRYDAPLRMFDADAPFPGMSSYSWMLYEQKITDEEHKKVEMELQKILER